MEYKDEYSDVINTYSNDEVLGSLCRAENTENLTNELIVRMGFNLLFEEELYKEKMKYDYGYETAQNETLPSIDGSENYNGPLIKIEFSADKLKEYINKIFGNIEYKNEDYILFTTCKEFDGPWTDKYAKYDSENNKYTLYYPYEAFGEAWSGLETIITDVNESETEISINAKILYCEYSPDEISKYYATWIPTVSKSQRILYPKETGKYNVSSGNGVAMVSNNVITIKNNSYNDEEYHEETLRDTLGTTNYNGYSTIINGKTKKYENYEEAYKQIYTPEVVNQLHTYKFTFKKDAISGHYYFNSFDKIN